MAECRHKSASQLRAYIPHLAREAAALFPVASLFALENQDGSRMKKGTSKPTPRNKELPRIRMTSDELDAIRANARNQSMSVSEYVRQVAIKGKIVEHHSKVDFQAVRELLKVGTNLNQIARQLNSGGSIAPVALRDTLATVREAVTKLVADVED